MKKLKRVFLLLTLLVITMQSTAFGADGLSIILNRRGAVRPKTAVLMYHMVSEVPEYINTYCITPQALEQDLIYFKNNGYIFATVGELDYVRRMNPDKNIAVLTFDDGYESDYKYVLPLLTKYDAKATFFVFASMTGKPFYMTEAQLKELAQSGRAEIGNHSYELHEKPLLEIRKLYSDYSKMQSIMNDFSTNKAVLEKITGVSVTSLSYPNGIYTQTIDGMMKNAGICTVSVSTEEHAYNPYFRAGIIGRYNRSDKRTAQDIVNILR